MVENKQITKLKKKLLTVGTGILVAASAASAIPFPVYAARTQAAETREVPDEVPGVTVIPGKGSDTTFEVVEVDTVWYRLIITVKDRKTGALLPGTTIYFERMNDDGRGSVGGIVFAKDSGDKLVKTGEDGQLTFELEVGKRYKIYVIPPAGYGAFVPDADQPEYIQIDNGSQNQPRTIYLDPKEEKPTEPTKPTEPAKPEPTEPTKPEPSEPVKPDHGGSGGSGGKTEKDPKETTSAERETTAPETTAPEPPVPEETTKGSVEETLPSGTLPEPVEPKPDQKKDDEYVIPGKDNKPGTEDDIIVRPNKDKDGNNNSSKDENGNITLPYGGELIHPTFPDQGKVKEIVPEGTVVRPDGTLEVPDGRQVEYVLPGKDARLDTADDVRVIPTMDDGKHTAEVLENGSILLKNGGTVIYPDGEEIAVPAGTIVLPDGTIIYPDDAAEASHVGFWNCWYHWLELVALILVLVIFNKRLMEIRQIHSELDEMDEERDQNSSHEEEE